LKERDNKNEIKEHIDDLKKMIKEANIAKNARGSILAVKGNDHNVDEAITKTFTAEYENKEEYDKRVK